MCQESHDCGHCPLSANVDMGAMKGVSSLGEVGGRRPVSHYASTPHLFVFQAVEDEEDAKERNLKEPIYSSAVDIRKDSSKQKVEAVKLITEKYDSLSRIGCRQDSICDDPLAVTEDDVARIETFFRGHRTKVWVCYTLANLYSENAEGDSSVSWDLKYTGVPLLLLDSGDTKSRSKRQLQLILAEKGTGFALWRDVVDNLTSYRAQEQHFHTFYLSFDHRRRMGLSFNDGRAAMEFYAHLERLTGDPTNISLSVPGKKKPKSKEKPVKYRPPSKRDISMPCNFQHVTNVSPDDKTRFFSLQAFSRKKDVPEPHTVIERIHPLPAAATEA